MKIEYFKKNWKSLLFFFLIAGSVFLRVYHFDDWLLAKGDQVRDAMVVSRAAENGPGELPLLGPRAGGTKLHLGPAFYYFQYAAAKIFGDTELPTLAYPNLLFSVASIFVFYLLLRNFFGKDASRALTVFYAFSFLAIEYSRFAWNPNSTPFFVLLFLYALLKILDANDNRKVLWYGLAGLAYAVASQLHFTNFLGFPMLAFFLITLNWKRWKEIISFRGISVFLAIVLFLYLPVILSEILSGGANTAQFIKAFSSKSSGGGLLENIGAVVYLYGKYFFRILSGYLGEIKVLHYFGIIFFLAGMIFNLILFRKEADSKRKAFLSITLAFLLAFFILYAPLGEKIDKPRFFLPIIYLPIIYLGYFYEHLKKKIEKSWAFLPFGIFLGLIAANLFFSFTWLAELSRSYAGALNPKDTVVLKMKKDAAWWTWNHFQALTDYAKTSCQDKDAYLSFAKNVREFEDTAQYALEQRGMAAHIAKNPTRIENRCVLYVSRTGDALNSDVSIFFDTSETQKFGSLEVRKLSAKNPQALPDDSKKENADDSDEESGANLEKYFWKDTKRILKL